VLFVQVPFQLRLNNGYMISITVSLVYEEANPVHQTGDSEVDDRQTSFLWTPVTRGGKTICISV